MEIKQLEVELRDFDTNDYSVEFIDKESAKSKPIESLLKKEEPTKLQEVINSDIESCNTEIPLVDGYKLQQYFLKRFKEVHGYEFVSADNSDIQIFDDFKNRYGDDAGPMIKILFDKHQGKLKSVDGVITINAFKKNAKWIQDMLYCELQEDKKNNNVDNSTEGLMSSHDFIRFFSVAE